MLRDHCEPHILQQLCLALQQPGLTLQMLCGQPEVMRLHLV